MSSNATLVPQASNFSSNSLTVILTTVLLVCFFIGFFSIYFCRYFLDTIISTWHFRRTPTGNIVNPATAPVNHGLDPALVQIFPTFTYSGVKEFRCDKFGLECAICLGEFTDDNVLRLITVCHHVFHKECIDLWLQSHKTCPVCRGDLDLPKETLEKSLTVDHNSDVNDAHETNVGVLENAVSINIDGGGNMEGAPDGRGTKEQQERNYTDGMFSRSHSTGHSIVEARRGEKEEEEEEEDRHTLRLQAHVREKIIRGHGAVRSCIAFGDFSTNKNGGLVEA